MGRVNPRLGCFGLIALLAVTAGCASTPRQDDAAFTPDRIQKLQLSRKDGRYEVRITGKRKPTFTVFRLVNPMRIVVDLANYDVRPLARPREIREGEVARIRARQFGDESLGIGRLELTLRTLAEFDSRVEGNSVVLTIHPDRVDPRSLAAFSQSDEAQLIDDFQADDDVLLEEEFIEDIPDEELFGDDDLFADEDAEEPATEEDAADVEAEPDTGVPAEGAAIVEEEPAVDAAAEGESVEMPVETPEGEEQAVESMRVEEVPEPEMAAEERVTEEPADAAVAEPELVEETSAEADRPAIEEPSDAVVAEPLTEEPTGDDGRIEETPVEETEVAAPVEENAVSEVAEEQSMIEEVPVQDLAEPLAEEPAPIEEDLFGEEPVSTEPIEAAGDHAEEVLPEIEEVDENEELARETLEGLDEATIEEAESAESTGVIQASQLTDLRWEEDGADLLVTIQANGPFGDYNAFKLDNPPRIVIDVWNVDSLIPGEEFQVDSPQIRTARIGVYPEKVRIVLDVNGDTTPEFDAEKAGDQLVVRVKPLPQPMEPVEEMAAVEPVEVEPVSSEEPVQIEVDGQAIEPTTMQPVAQSSVDKEMEAVEEHGHEAETEAPDTPVVMAAVPHAKEEEEVEPMPTPKGTNVGARPIAMKLQQQQRPTDAAGVPQKVYKGRKINLDFKDADIDSVLRLIAEVSNLNIVTDEEVAGTISIRLVNVPWDQALDVVLAAKQLGMRKLGNIVRVAPIDKLQAEDEARLKALEDRELLLPLFIRVVPVNYADAKEVAKRIEPLLSDRGNVDVDSRTNVLIIKDIKRNLDDAVTLVRSLDSPTPQVLIEAKIVEANTTFTRELGVQWGYGGNFAPEFGNRNLPGRFGVSGGSAGNFSPDGVFPANQAIRTQNLAVDLPAAVGTGSGGALGFVFGSLDNSNVLDLRLSAMESSGEGRIISSPRITTLDNEKAKISQGISIPFQTVSANGTQTQFVDAALQLEVTPHITPDRSVLLKFKISKNAPDSTFTAGTGVPSISKKEAQSRMLVADGETAVIGGIFTLDKGHSISAVPWFSKIPVIGWFFKKKQSRETKTELLLFITPRVVVD